MNIQLSRIILFGKDITALRLFYQEHFGFTLVEEIESLWVVLQAGPIQIAFHKIGAAYFPENGEPFKAESNTKIVFEVAEGLPALRESLLQKGVLVHDIKSFEPSLSLYCDGEDIEGNVFQLAQTKR